MKNILNKRLQTISAFIEKEDIVLDIGCDHALLGIYLVLNKKIKVIGSDINTGPLEKAKEMDITLFPYEGAEDIDHTREIFGKIEKDSSVAIFIGPEGGFDAEEATKAKEAGAKEITLGNRILRTETAGMMIMSVLMYLFEE